MTECLVIFHISGTNILKYKEGRHEQCIDFKNIPRRKEHICIKKKHCYIHLRVDSITHNVNFSPSVKLNCEVTYIKSRVEE